MPVVQDPSRTGEQLVLTGGGCDGSRGRGDVSFFASTGAPAAAPCGGTGCPELASKAEVLQEPMSCIDSHQPPQTGAQLAPSGLREPLWAAGTKGIRSCVGGVITPDALAGLRVCARERGRCAGTCAFLLQPPIDVATEVCFKRPQIRLSSGRNKSQSCGRSPLACRAPGDQSPWEARGGGGRAEFKPSHYAPRYRDQKATSQINEALAWAEPLPGTDGWEGSVP